MSSESRIWEIRPFGSMRGESELVLGRWASQPNRSRLLYAGRASWQCECVGPPASLSSIVGRGRMFNLERNLANPAKMALVLKNPDGTYASKCALCGELLSHPIYAT